MMATRGHPPNTQRTPHARRPLAPPALLVLLLAASAPPASSAEVTLPTLPPTLAVLELQGEGMTPALSQACTDLARASLIQTLGPRALVLTPENQAALLIENGRDAEAVCTDESCDVELLRTLDVDYGLSGRVNQIGGQYYGTLTLYDTASGRALAVEKLRAQTDAELITQVERRAVLLARRFPGTATGQGARGPRRDGPLGASGAALSDEAREGFLHLTSTPPGAMVLSGGEPLCAQTPCQKRIPRGVYELRFALADHRAAVRVVEVDVEEHAVHVDLQPAYARLWIDTGGIPVGLRVDDRPIPPADARGGLRLDPGPHEVYVDDPCYARVGERVTLGEGAAKRITLHPTPREARVRVRAIDRNQNDVATTVFWQGRELGHNATDLVVPLCTRQLQIAGTHQRIVVDLPPLVEAETTQVEVLLDPGGDQGVTSWQDLPRAPDRKTGIVWIRLPAGTFHPGCAPHDDRCEPDERPGRVVTTEPFWMMETEVTVDAYRRCAKSGACKGRPCDREPRHAANCIDWHQARSFCRWVGGRLPSSVEWEYAAKSGAARIYPWGDDPPDDTLAHFAAAAPADVATHPAGRTPFGLYDLAGGVWEWTDGGTDDEKPLMGGGWQTRSSAFLRNSYRQRETPDFRDPQTGFRCVR